MAHRSMIWWFIGGTAGHPYLKSNHQRVQVWIQHQKFTNRSFYIKSLIKKKSHMKSLVWDSCLFVLFGKSNPPEKHGDPTKPKVLPWTAWLFNMAHRSMIWWFIGGTSGHPYLKSNPWTLSTKKKCCRDNMFNFRVDNLFASRHFPGIHTVRLPKMPKVLC